MNDNGDEVWHLYVLLCKDGSYYTGISTDVERRIEVHNEGKGSRYTRSRRPVRLVYEERCGGRSKALKKEYEMKQRTRKAKEEYMKRFENKCKD